MTSAVTGTGPRSDERGRTAPRRGSSSGPARLGLLLFAAVVLPVWHLTASGRADLGVLLDVALGGRETTAQLIVWELGLPRLACALLAGAALGVSGLVLQSALRNPLAAPEITGVNSGAVLGVLIAISSGLTATDAVRGTLVAALLGGIAGGALTWIAARSSGPRALIVYGLLCSAALSAFTTLLLSAQPSRFGLLLRWLAGSVAGRVWEHLLFASAWIAIALIAAWLAAPLLTVLSLGDGQASSLGVRPDTARLGVLMLAVALASGAVALAGAIAFVGLAAPHAARWIAGIDPRRAIPAAAAAGALAVAGADAAAMWIGGRIAGSQAGGLLAVPTGAVTAVVGAAVLIAVIGRSKHVSD